MARTSKTRATAADGGRVTLSQLRRRQRAANAERRAAAERVAFVADVAALAATRQTDTAAAFARAAASVGTDAATARMAARIRCAR